MSHAIPLRADARQRLAAAGLRMAGQNIARIGNLYHASLGRGISVVASRHASLSREVFSFRLRQWIVAAGGPKGSLAFPGEVGRCRARAKFGVRGSW